MQRAAMIIWYELLFFPLLLLATTATISDAWRNRWTRNNYSSRNNYLAGRITSGLSFYELRGGGGSNNHAASDAKATTATAASSSTNDPVTPTSPTPTADDPSTTPGMMIRIAYQGEPGAYSEKATRELLGRKVTAIGRPSFEDCFRAVASMECDYACLPIENSLGGSIHDNYDLMLRYDLTIIAEHEFRVSHCLLAKDGVELKDIKYAISHPQALAQCDNFLRGLGITPVPTYDTAGSAKMISAGAKLPAKCTPENTAAIASDLAGLTYGLKCLNKGIEDDDTNFTRFLLLARKDVVQFLNKRIPAKTSVVFTLPDSPGALYKALACFSLRDIDCTKIESRPTSASLLNFLKFKSQQMGRKSRNKAELPRFRYCFYLDFLASQLNENTQNALSHLREQADFLRILGSYPQKSRLVGPVAQSVEQLKHIHVDPDDVSSTSLPSDSENIKPLNIGIIGFGRYGQFLARRFTKHHRISCLDRSDVSKEARDLGVEYYPHYEMSKFLADLDVVLLAVALIDFEDVVTSLPVAGLRGKLVVDVSPLNTHPKAVLLRTFGNIPDIDILSSHPMFGPLYTNQDPYLSIDATTSSADQDGGAVTVGSSGGGVDRGASWDGRPMVYEKVRISDSRRCDKFLKIFEQARCRMVEMTAEEHDKSIADAEFVTHLTGRLIGGKDMLPPTPVMSKEYAALCDVADMTSGDSFDLFFGMYQFTEGARDHLIKMRENLATIERQLAAKEAYLAASAEMKHSDRQRLLAETKLLLEEVISSKKDEAAD